MDLGGAPLLGVVAERRPPARWVDVDPVGQVAAHGVEEALGVALSRELASLLGPTRVLPPPGPVPAVGTLVDARHGCLTLREGPSRTRSGPQKVLRSSKSPQLGGLFWSLTVTNGSCWSSKTAGQRLF